MDSKHDSPTVANKHSTLRAGNTDNARSPGKQALTRHLPARTGAPPLPDTARAPGTSSDRTLATEMTARWTDTAMRPDLYGAPPILRSATTAATPAGDADGAFAAATSSGAGEVPYRREMEQAFQTDFSGVQAHLGRRDEMAALSAHAATRGESIAFADQAPDRELVAHELTHIVQGRADGGERIARKAALSQPDDAAEREANALAPRAAAGERVSVSERVGARIHRSLLTDVQDALNKKDTPAEICGLGAWMVITNPENDSLQSLLQLSLVEIARLLRNVPDVIKGEDTVVRVAAILSTRLDDFESPATFVAAERQIAEALLELLDEPGVAMLCMKRLYGPDFTGQRGAQWDVAGLRRMHRVLKELPQNQVVGHPLIQHFVRDAGDNGQGAFDNGQVTLAYDPTTMANDVYQAPGVGARGFANADDPAIGKNKFDRAVRHEMGHAVDESIGASAQYFRDTGPCWQTHMLPDVIALMFQKKPIEGMDEELTKQVVTLLSTQVGRGKFNAGELSESLDTMALASVAQSEAEALMSSEDKEAIAAEKERLRKERENKGETEEERKEREEREAEQQQMRDIGALWSQLDGGFKKAILSHPVLEVLEYGTSKPWFSPDGGAPEIDGRIYQDTQNGDWASYDLAARKNQVSNYQFKSPAEFFAEAYATYYDPDGGPKQLQDADPATYDWFVANVVGKGLNPLPPPQ